MAYPEPPREDEPAVLEFLRDIDSRKEFRTLLSAARRATEPDVEPGADEAFRNLIDDRGPEGAKSGAGAYLSALEQKAPSLDGLRLHGAQQFVRNFINPNTPYTRELLNWQTGGGKTLGALAISAEFAAVFRRHPGAAAERPTVFVVGFTQRLVQDEMLRHPELGFVSAAELGELVRLGLRARRAGGGSTEARQYTGFKGRLRRRITDRAMGGYFRFYGYKEFANRLFRPTRRGAERGVRIADLYARPARPARRAGGEEAEETEGGEEAEGASESFGAVGEFTSYTIGAAEGEASESFRDTSESFRDTGAAEGETFVARVGAAVAAGDIALNTALLDSMRGGLLICDEIHNAYNVLAKNNYGLAIQYALDALDAEGGAPRAVFMSATATGGSPTEVVDLLNFLVPAGQRGGALFRRRDFFARGATGLPELRPGALERIGLLAAGRVSFLAEAEEAVGATDGGRLPAEGYPRRRLEGVTLAGHAHARGAARGPPELIRYLRFVACPMPPRHRRALEAALAADGSVPGNAQTLYDIVFPDPRDPEGGLYGAAAARAAAAPPELLAAAGVRAGEQGGPPGGDYLRLENVGAFSAKYEALARDVVDALERRPGKVMIYHGRVRGSGVLLVRELLLANGLIEPGVPPRGDTRCAVCGRPRDAHPEPGEEGAGPGEEGAGPTEEGAGPTEEGAESHAYAPARFAVISSLVDRARIDALIAAYNAPSNLDGRELRVLVGSKIIREAFNLVAVRHQLILSHPPDISTLLQILGRVVRRGSHAQLPPAERDVRVRIYVSTFEAHPADGGADAAPEVGRYALKMRLHLVTQAVERELRRYAADAPAGVRGATLAALPFEPAVGPLPPARPAGGLSTFAAYGYGGREAALLGDVVRALFRARPVWTYADLWAAARRGGVQGVAVDPRDFSEESFAVALDRLARHPPGTDRRPAAPAWPEPRGGGGDAISRFGEYYVRTPVDAAGHPVADVEAYVRGAPRGGRIRVPVSRYVARRAAAARVFELRLAEFVEAFADPRVAILSAFTAHSPSFLTDLCRYLVEHPVTGKNAPARRRAAEAAAAAAGEGAAEAAEAAEAAAAVSGALRRADALFREYKVILSAAELRARGLDPRPGTWGAVVVPDRVEAFAGGAGGGWYALPRLVDARPENDVLVGLYEGWRDAARFKLRPPAGAGWGAGGDRRARPRGKVCETFAPAELAAYAAALSIATTQRGAARLCSRIQGRLMDLEAAARNASRPEQKRRWVYLFNETP